MLIFSLICCAIAAVGILALLWMEFLRPQPKVQELMTFEFPKGLTSGDVGYIIDGRVDDRDVVSLIPWFASQGYLEMEKSTENMTKKGDGATTNLSLHKLAELPKDAPEYERIFFNEGLFPKGRKTFDISYKYSSNFAKVWADTKREIRRSHPRLNEEYKYGVPAIFCTFIFTFLGIGFGLGNTGYAVAMGLIGLFCLAPFIMAYLMDDFSETTTSTKLKLSLMALGMYAVPAFALYAYTDYRSPEEGPLLLPCELLWALYLGLTLAGTFSARLRRPTQWRLDRLGELYGLRNYIRVAEKEELRRIVTDNPCVWYKILSYALTFNLAPSWENRFRGLKMMVYGQSPQ